MNNIRKFDDFANESREIDNYTSTCDCGQKVTSREMSFSVENSYDRGGKVIARYICPKCKQSHRIRTILSPSQAGL